MSLKTLLFPVADATAANTTKPKQSIQQLDKQRTYSIRGKTRGMRIFSGVLISPE